MQVQEPVKFEIDFKENASPVKNSPKIKEKLEERKKLMESSPDKMNRENLEEKLAKAEGLRKQQIEAKTRVL